MCNPDFFFNCGVCCMLLSIWGVIQLGLMGMFYWMESTPLIEDVVPKNYSSYEEFIVLTKVNYAMTAVNCWVATAIYVVTGMISGLCIVLAHQSKADMLKKAEAEELGESPEKSKGVGTLEKSKGVGQLEKSKGVGPLEKPKDKKQSKINPEDIKHSEKKKSGIDLSSEDIKKKKSGGDLKHFEKKKSGTNVKHPDKKKSGQDMRHSDKKKSGEDTHSEKKPEKKDKDEDPYFK